MGSFSIALYFRLSKGHSCWGLFLLVSMPVLACRDRVTIVMAPLPECDWAVVPCPHGCPGFFQRHSPQQSPSSNHLRPEAMSPESTEVFALGFLSNVPLQFLATIHSGELASLSVVCRATTWKSVWFSLHLDCHRSVALPWQPQMLPICPNWLPLMWGSHPYFSCPTA